MGGIEEAWRSVDSSTNNISGIAKRLTTSATKAATASASGVVAAATKALDGLSEDLQLIAAALDTARLAMADVESQLTSPNALAREVEAELRTVAPDRTVWRSMSDVVAFPVVVNVRPPKVTVDKHQVNSQRPGVIIGTIMDTLKASSSPDRFLRALHTAYRLLSGGQPSGQAALGLLHQVLATVPPGGTIYSMLEFRADLQWLYASGTRSVDDVTVRFDVASAGPSAVPVFDGEGNLVNLGYVTFAPRADADV